jgi:signal transduction histidine kinase
LSAFRDLPIRRKLLLLMMLVSGGTLLVASTGLISSDFLRFRRDMAQNLRTLADVVARNSTAPLTFDDQAAAEDTLTTLGAQASVVTACIYHGNGEIFAEYHRSGGERVPCPERPGRAPSHRFADGSLALFEPILLQGERIGVVFVRSDLEELYGRLKVQAATVTVVLLAAALFAFLLSSGLQASISRPILHLAGMARAVSERRDYSLRAGKQSADEIGQLVDAFNDMLSQIQRRDADLRQAKDELEQRVEERTEALRLELVERRRAEKELEERNVELHQSNKELDDFAYIASHDLKEPLRGIHNYSVFLLEDYADKLDDEGKSKLETLIRLTRRMESLIDSLLHFSRVGRLDLAVDEVDLNEIVSGVLEGLAFNLQEQRVEVRIPRPLPTLRCDRARVGEIFSNLIVNAMKYNDKAEKWIEIGVAEGVQPPPLELSPESSGAVPLVREEPGPGPALYVRDNGIGIQEKHFDSIFRIFKRLHARDKFGGGTGAGLTIVKKIVERHNGRIWVDSTYGTGTTVYFTLGQPRASA